MSKKRLFSNELLAIGNYEIDSKIMYKNLVPTLIQISELKICNSLIPVKADGIQTF
jgi:hypothetical protein